MKVLKVLCFIALVGSVTSKSTKKQQQGQQDDENQKRKNALECQMEIIALHAKATLKPDESNAQEVYEAGKAVFKKLYLDSIHKESAKFTKAIHIKAKKFKTKMEKKGHAFKKMIERKAAAFHKMVHKKVEQFKESIKEKVKEFKKKLHDDFLKRLELLHGALKKHKVKAIAKLVEKLIKEVKDNGMGYEKRAIVDLETLEEILRMKVN